MLGYASQDCSAHEQLPECWNTPGSTASSATRHLVSLPAKFWHACICCYMRQHSTHTADPPTCTSSPLRQLLSMVSPCWTGTQASHGIRRVQGIRGVQIAEVLQKALCGIRHAAEAPGIGPEV